MANLYLIAPGRSGAQSVLETITRNRDWASKTEVLETPPAHTVSYDPQDCYNIAALATEDPEARFIVVSRTPVEVMSSALEAWRSGKFVTHPDLPGWWGEKWSLQLSPNWEAMIGAPLAEITANQFCDAFDAAIQSLEKLDPKSWTGFHFEDFVASPAETLGKSMERLGLRFEMPAGTRPEKSKSTLSNPSPNKWHRNAAELITTMNAMEQRFIEVNRFRHNFGPLPKVEPPQKKETQKPQKQPSSGTPFASSFTSTFREMLKQAGASVVISTYKSGRLITARVDGESINTDFQAMNKPMGIAASGSRLAVGTKDSVLSFANQPSLAKAIKGDQVADAVFAPRSEIITGDISIHEMGFGTTADDRGLYFINTSFSCICVLDFDYSWVPVWRPKWISSYAPEDRCHLNGMAMVDGKPKYVTALSQTDTPNGWRDLKGTSGVIVDIDDDRVVTSGLAMPHSPRWYRDQLWVLESGKGTLAKVDLDSGSVETVATLPGFTRGLTFIDKFALVGLSQVRESVFKSLPITDTAAQRNCGVWVVNIETGNIVGFLRFDGEVQEIFDVAVLFGAKWTEFIRRSDHTQTSFVLPQDVIADFKPSRNQVP